MQVRQAALEEERDILDIEARAFDGDQAVVQLVRNLLSDPTASPTLSMVAYEGATLVGHILLTRAWLKGHKDVTCRILAPLAVVPEHQRAGVGTLLGQRAIDQCKSESVYMIFVLGYPVYYERLGFQRDAASFGLLSPFPLPRENAAAWMVLDLTGDLLGRVHGIVQPPFALHREEYWRE